MGYLIVLVALLIATGLTYYTGTQVALPGSWNLVVALVIAVAKATTVCLFFMHLWGDSKVNQLIAVLAAALVVLMISLTIVDVNTRFPLAAPPGSMRSKVPVTGTLD
jgi:cytochrome c oxidase subunit 4